MSFRSTDSTAPAEVAAGQRTVPVLDVPPSPRRRPPASLMWLLAGVLVLGIAWALATPPWQAPDENSHFGYVQHLAETGDLPGDPRRPLFSSEQSLASGLSGADQVAALKQGRPLWYKFDGRSARRLAKVARNDGGGPNPAASNPPLYYLTAAPAYLATSGGSIFTRLRATRLVSLLWLLLTTVAAWMLAGELFARDQPKQLVTAAVAGLVPMVTFISASVTPDAALYALCTTVLWLGVRVIRRGTTSRSAFALGAATGAAILVKSTSYALVPGVAMAVVVGVLRGRRTVGLWRPLLAAALTLAVVAVPLLVWWWIASGLDRAATGQLAGANTDLTFDRLREFTSYVWQFYLPALPFQHRYETYIPVPGVWEYWIKGFWGSFGWLEVRYAVWVYWLCALGTAAALMSGAVVLVRARRRVDLAVVAFLALVAVALVFGLHWTDYNNLESGRRFMQGRYLFPLVGVFGVAVSAGLTLLPARARLPAAGATIGALFALQLLGLGTLLTRFYA